MAWSDAARRAASAARRLHSRLEFRGAERARVFALDDKNWEVRAVQADKRLGSYSEEKARQVAKLAEKNWLKEHVRKLLKLRKIMKTGKR